ncbi:hypothetical protein [Glaciecola sp. 1036]|uniref:hypothetical protein n=1 Tax=Alteromonadaceae TaxID=72275 RepID=UPI003D080081
MKVIIASIIVLVFAGLAYWWTTQSESNEVLEIESTQSSHSTADKIAQGDDILDKVAEKEQVFNSLTEEQRSEEIIKVQEEMDVLMARYDRNISDPSRRDQIKQEMRTLMAKYDQLVLQKALADMKNSKG